MTGVDLTFTDMAGQPCIELDAGGEPLATMVKSQLGKLEDVTLRHASFHHVSFHDHARARDTWSGSCHHHVGISSRHQLHPRH